MIDLTLTQRAKSPYPWAGPAIEAAEALSLSQDTHKHPVPGLEQRLRQPIPALTAVPNGRVHQRSLSQLVVVVPARDRFRVRVNSDPRTKRVESRSTQSAT